MGDYALADISHPLEARMASIVMTERIATVAGALAKGFATLWVIEKLADCDEYPVFRLREWLELLLRTGDTPSPIVHTKWWALS